MKETCLLSGTTIIGDVGLWTGFYPHATLKKLNVLIRMWLEKMLASTEKCWELIGKSQSKSEIGRIQRKIQIWWGDPLKAFWRPNKNRLSSDCLCQEARPLPLPWFGCLGSNGFIKWLPSVHFATSWYILMVICHHWHWSEVKKNIYHGQSEVCGNVWGQVFASHNIHNSILKVSNPSI